MRRLGLRLVPGGLLLLGATALVFAPALREAAAPLRPAAFAAVVAAGLLLAWRFNRGRLGLALGVLALAGLAVLVGVPAAPARARFLRDAVALLLPLDLGVLAWLPDWGPLSRRGRLALVGVAAEALVLALFSHPDAAPATAWLHHALVDARWLSWTAVPQPALLAFVAALAATGIRFGRDRRPAEAGLLWTLVAAFAALSLDADPLATSVYFTAAGLVLAVSLVETSHTMAFGDELTGLPARRALNEALQEVGGQYAVAMVDIDHFKKFNDEHGHDVGDQLLRMVGGRLARVTGGGRPFRYGGEEFAVIFPGLSVDEALPHLEELRKAIEGSDFVVRNPGRPRKKPATARPAPPRARRTVGVTVSIGVADARKRGATPAAVIKAADQALYRAKRGGRNRVCAQGPA